MSAASKPENNLAAAAASKARSDTILVQICVTTFILLSSERFLLRSKTCTSAISPMILATESMWPAGVSKLALQLVCGILELSNRQHDNVVRLAMTSIAVARIHPRNNEVTHKRLLLTRRIYSRMSLPLMCSPPLLYTSIPILLQTPRLKTTSMRMRMQKERQRMIDRWQHLSMFVSLRQSYETTKYMKYN